MAIRSALGAARSRLWRQLLIESLSLSAVGGAAGLLLAAWGVRVLEASLPPNVLPVPDIGIDPTVVVFAVGVTLVTGVLFGFAPAWQSATMDVNTTFKAGGRSASGSVRPLLRKTLACVEITLATVLLVGAGLLVRTLSELQRVPLGFEPDGVLSFQISLPPTKYDNAKRVGFFRELVESLREIPGVRSAAASSGIPFGAGNYNNSPFGAPGKSLLPPGTSVSIDWRTASPCYFQTMRIPLLRGRDFTTSDVESAPSVMIVSRATARTM